MISSSRKTELRAQALERRSSVSWDLRRVFERGLVASGLQAVEGLGLAVSLFLPIRDEPDTLSLLAALAATGRDTALPVTPPRGEPLIFRRWRPGDPLAAGRFGTREPVAEAPEIDPDVLVVPLAAFDRRGHRLGYGAGYYDGALRRLRQAKPIYALGLAFSVQEVDSVPAEPHDERLDAVLTEHGLLTFGPFACASSSSAT